MKAYLKLEKTFEGKFDYTILFLLCNFIVFVLIGEFIIAITYSLCIIFVLVCLEIYKVKKQNIEITIQNNLLKINKKSYKVSSVKFVCGYSICSYNFLGGRENVIKTSRRLQIIMKINGKYTSVIYDELDLGEENFNKLDNFCKSIKTFREEIDELFNYDCIILNKSEKINKILANLRLKAMLTYN